MNTYEIAAGSLSGIVQGFGRAAKKKFADGDVVGAMKCLDTLLVNFADPPSASPAYVNARQSRADMIYNIECGE